MRTWLYSLLLVVACTPDGKPVDDTDSVAADADTDADSDTDTDADTDSDTDTDTDPACTARVVDMSPADGELDVASDAPVVARFSEPVTAVDLVLDNDATGTVVIGGDGTFATFVADGGLAYGTTYTASATVCDDTVEASFTTQGEPLDVDLAERTYDIELDDESDLVWVAPSLGAFLADSLATTSILLMVESADTAQIDVVGAAGYEFRDATAQYPCTYAIDFPSVPFTRHPAFDIGPLDAEMEANGIAFTIHELAMTGVFSDDGTEANDLVLTGLLDTRSLSEGLALDICALAEGFGDACVACPDGEIGCLDLEVHDERAPWREGLTVDVDHDPTIDPHCAD